MDSGFEEIEKKKRDSGWLASPEEGRKEYEKGLEEYMTEERKLMKALLKRKGACRGKRENR